MRRTTRRCRTCWASRWCWSPSDDALLSLYGLRMVTVLAAGAVCVLAAHLAARRFHGGQAVRAALGAGLAVALLPAIADSGGRFNTDIFAALAVLVVVLALLRWVEHRSAARAWQVGGALALAALTRETTLVVVVPLVVAGVALARRRELRLGDLARELVPPALAITAWELHLQASTGRYNGAGAFVDQYGRQFPTLGFGDVISGLLSRGYLPVRPLGPPGRHHPAGVRDARGRARAGRSGRAPGRGGDRRRHARAAAVGDGGVVVHRAQHRIGPPAAAVVPGGDRHGHRRVGQHPARAATYLPALATLLMATWFMVAELWPTYR